MNSLAGCFAASSLFQYFMHLPSLAFSCNDLLSSPVFQPEISFADYLQYFLLTYALELPIYWVGLYKLLPKNNGIGKVLTINLILNLATHPLVCLVFPVFALKYDLNYAQYITIAEVFAFVFEGLLLAFIMKRRILRCLAIALVANIISWNVGALFF